ncbi:MAG: molybdenum cofactor guanylyltransferase [Burkholderiales bacterium]|nr:molybdenum cofactor guanylyltransferase [Burkholderiales bacterium]
MGGVDKGLQPYQGRPLADWVLDALSKQLCAVNLNANRHLPQYADLLRGVQPMAEVWPDDPDIAGSLGPLAGILTGLRRSRTPWLMVASCDAPHIPKDLVERLHQSAVAQGADIAVPVTTTPQGDTHHHWVCALIHTRCKPSLEAALSSGERRVGRWIQSCAWVGVSFAAPADFTNINTLEALHEQA